MEKYSKDRKQLSPAVLQSPSYGISPALTSRDKQKGKIDLKLSHKLQLSPQSTGNSRFFSPIVSPSTMNSCESDFLDFDQDKKKINQEKSMNHSNAKSTDKTLQRYKGAYNSQMHYMQEYIHFLKDKLQKQEVNSKKLEQEDKTLSNSKDFYDYQSEIKYLTQIITKKDIEISNYLDEISEKQRQVFELSEKLSRLEERSEQRESRISRASEETSSIDRDQKRRQEKSSKDLEITCLNYRIDIQLKNEEILHLKDVIKTYQNHIKEESYEALANKLQENINQNIGKFDHEFELIKEKVVKSEEKVYSLMKTIRFLQSNSLYNSSANSKLNLLEKELTERFEQENKINIMKLEKNNELVKELQGENYELIEKLAAAGKLINQLQDENHEFIEKLTTADNNLEKLIEINEQEKQNAERLEKILKDAKEEHILESNFRQRLNNELENTLKSMAEELIFEKNNYQRLNKESQSLNDKLNELNLELQEKNKELDTLFDSLNLIELQLNKTPYNEDIKIENNTIEKTSKYLNYLNTDIEEKKNLINELKKNNIEKRETIESLEKENNATHLKNQNLVKEITRLESEINNLKNHKEIISNELTEKEKKIIIIYNDLLNCKTEIEDKSILLEEASTNVSELKKNISDLNSKLNDKTTTIEHLEKRIENQVQSIDQQKKFNNSLQDIINKNTKTINDNQKLMCEKNSMIISLEENLQELAYLKIDQEKIIEEYKIDISKKIKSYSDLINQLSDEKSSLQKSLIELENLKNSEIKEYKEECYEYELIIEDLNSKIKQYNMQTDNLQVDRQNLKLKGIESETKLTKINMSLSEEINIYKLNESKLKREISSLVNHNNQLQEKLDMIDENISKLSKENSLLKLKNQENEANSQIIRTKQDQIISELQIQIEELNKTINDLEKILKLEVDKNTSLLQDKDISYKCLSESINELKKQNYGLNQQIKIKSNTINELESSIAQFKAECDENNKRTENEIHKNEIKINEQAENLRLLNEAFKEIKENNDNLNKDLSNKNLQIEKYNNQIEEFSDNIQLAKGRESDLLETIKELRQALEEKNEQIKKLEQQVRNCEDLLKEIQLKNMQNNKDKENIIKDKENEIIHYIQENKRSNLQIDNLNIEIKSLKLKHLELENSLVSINLELKSEIDNLTVKAKEYTKENMNLIRYNEDLKEKIKRFDIDIMHICEENNKLKHSIELNENNNKNKRRLLEKSIKVHQESENSVREEIKHLELMLENEKQKLLSQILRKEEQINALLEEIEEYRKNIENFKVDVNQLLQKNRKLELNAIENESKFNEELENYNQKLKQKDSEFINLCKSKNTGEALNKKLIDIKQELEEKINLFELKLKNVENINKKLETEKEEYLKRLQQLNESLETEIQIKNHKEVKIQQLNSDITALNKETANLKDSLLQEKQEKEIILYQEKEKYDNKQYEVEECKYEIDKLLIEINNYKLQALESETNLVRTNIELTEEIKQLKANEKKIKREIDNTNKYNSDLKQNLLDLDSKVASFYEEIELLRLKYAEVDEKNKQLEKKELYLMQELEEYIGKYKDISENNHELKRILVDNEVVINDLRYKILLQEDNMKEEKKIEENMEEIIEEDIIALDNQEQYINKVKQDNLKLGGIINSLEKELETEKNKFEEIIYQKDSLIEELSTTINQYKDQTEKLLNNIQISERNYENIEKEYADKNNELVENLNNTRKAFGELKIKNKEIIEKVNEIKEKNHILETSIQEASNKNNQLNKYLKESSDENNQLKKYFEDEKNKSKEDLSKAIEENTILRKEILQLQGSIENLKRILKESSAFEINEIREKLIQLETKTILLQHQKEKDQSEIQKLQEMNLQQMNLYKISALGKDLEEKTIENSNLLEINERLKIEQRRLKEKEAYTDALIEQLSEKENILSSLMRIDENSIDGKVKIHDLIARATTHVQKVQVLKSNLVKFK